VIEVDVTLPEFEGACNETPARGIYTGVPSIEVGQVMASRAASFEDLYREQYEGMVRLAYLLCGTHALAEDLVQESFAQVHQRWNQIEHPTTYLRTCVINATRVHHRRRARERSHFPELVADTVTADTPILMDAVARLPHRQRVALTLRYFEDRPEAEIAEILRCRPATVRSLIHRGLAALREVIER
jgi:RNA polymerase sigma-70 factor (sigma-E family)